MVLRILLYILLAYFLYKLIFNFIIPVHKTTKKLKKGFREMQERMQESVKEREPFNPAPPKPDSNPPKKGDYIDFEEIR